MVRKHTMLYAASERQMSKRMTLRALLALCILSAGCDALHSLGDPFVKDAAFSTLDDAAASGGMEMGWIPSILPDLAKEIRERHCLDTNEIWLTFMFDSYDESALHGWGEEMHSGQLVFPKSPNRFGGYARVDWWPTNLRKKLADCEKVRSWRRRQAEGDKAGLRPSYMVLDKAEGIGYYWAL